MEKMAEWKHSQWQIPSKRSIAKACEGVQAHPQISPLLYHKSCWDLSEVLCPTSWLCGLNGPSQKGVRWGGQQGPPAWMGLHPTCLHCPLPSPPSNTCPVKPPTH